MDDVSENWRPIPGTDGKYDVSDQGHVRSWIKPGTYGGRREQPRVLRPIMSGTRHNYHQVSLGRADRRYVHQLVLEVFVGPRPEGMVSCHTDDDSSNNALTNLRWDTAQANYDDRTRNGGQSRGQRARRERERALRA